MSQSDIQSDLQTRLNATGWHLFRTVLLGAIAAGLAIYGQHALTEARPIFPLIDQNFGLWQTSYVGAVLLVAVTWLLAMRQKLGLYQNCLHHMKMQRIIEEQRQRRAEREEAQRKARAERRAQIEAEREAARAVDTPFMRKNARSTKFDY